MKTTIPGCSRFYTNFSKTNSNKTPITHTSRKSSNIKSELDVSEIHEKLRMVVAKQGTLSSGNIAAATLTVEVKVKKEGESTERREFIEVPLKVPSKRVYCYTDVVESIQKDLIGDKDKHLCYKLLAYLNGETPNLVISNEERYIIDKFLASKPMKQKSSKKFEVVHEGYKTPIKRILSKIKIGAVNLQDDIDRNDLAILLRNNVFLNFANEYCCEKEILDRLGNLYFNGRNYTNLNGNTHGKIPDYDLEKMHSRGAAQYITHSEQALYAYLSTKEASDMIAKVIRTKIRGKYLAKLHSKVKIYNINMHIHSQKSPCSSCEYIMVGSQVAHMQELPTFKFKDNLINSLIEDGYFDYHYPSKEENFNILTTYTSDETDKDHGKTIKPTERQLELFHHIPTRCSNNINTRNHVFLHIHDDVVTDKQLEDSDINLSEYSIFSSATRNNSDLETRENSYASARQSEIDKLETPEDFFDIQEYEEAYLDIVQISQNNSLNKTSKLESIGNAIQKIPNGSEYYTKSLHILNVIKNK